MITYTTGDLLKSHADAFVNTVNCEGYMGKGIAYQFKMEFPENNISYVKACKNKTIRVGVLHTYKEKGKLIINFPTKDKWRASSKLEYIQNGLDALYLLLVKEKIKSIAIPPLGSGNGGLPWVDVKNIIENKLSNLDNIDIFIYEPSKNYTAKPIKEPILSTSGLILMEMKNNLKKFNKLRLQKAAFISNIFSNQEYFTFKMDTYGPYDHSIDIISKNIKEYQDFNNVKNTKEAQELLLKKIVSDKTKNIINIMYPASKKACFFINTLPDDKMVENVSIILFLILKNNNILNKNDLIEMFQSWCKDKKERFSLSDIENGIMILESYDLIRKNFIGYSVPTKYRIETN